MLYYIILYCIYYIILYYIILYYVILGNSLAPYIVLYYYITLHYIVLYHIILYYIILHYSVVRNLREAPMVAAAVRLMWSPLIVILTMYTCRRKYVIYNVPDPIYNSYVRLHTH